MSGLRVVHVVGARPNFMKAAPVMGALSKYKEVEQMLVHTGQHYDENMSKVFLNDLGLGEPDAHLGSGSETQIKQIAKMMVGFEEIIGKFGPDLVMVVGDVNSTFACAVTAVKLGVKVAHVEAGLRCYDRTMPEEINRVLTDQIAFLLFTPSRDADDNLIREGIPKERIHFVGNVMIDSLVKCQAKATSSKVIDNLGIQESEYAVLTLHRPCNVDNRDVLAGIMNAVGVVQNRIPVIFPVHPRTQKQLTSFGLSRHVHGMGNLHLVSPLGYLDFVQLCSRARIVLTDSGGIQEETTYFRVPCLVLRDSTERPITVNSGSGRLVGADPHRIIETVKSVLASDAPTYENPELWDGRAAFRIADAIARAFSVDLLSSQTVVK